MKKNKSLSSRIFYNDKVLLILALLAAIVIWLYIAVEKNVPTTKTFYDLNVTAEGAKTIEEKYGLECYGLENIEPSVVVEGQRYIVGTSDFKDSIVVSVDVSKIYDVGEYTLPVEAEINSDDTTTTVTSVSPDSVNVFFDKPTTKTFEIEIVPDSEITAEDGYVLGEAFANPEKVTFTGPSTEIKKIESVTAKISADAPLSATATYNTEYEINTTDGSTLTYSKADISSDIEIQVPVYRAKEFSTEAVYTGAPEGFEQYISSVTISPSTVYGGVYISSSDESEKISIPIDFSKIVPGENTIKVSAEDVEAENDGFIIVDDIKEFTVIIETVNLSQKSVTITSDDIEVTGGEFDSVTPDTQVVTIIGPTSEVSEYDVGNIALYADISSVDVQKGSAVVSLTLGEDSNCWLINSPTATVKIQ